MAPAPCFHNGALIMPLRTTRCNTTFEGKEKLPFLNTVNTETVSLSDGRIAHVPRRNIVVAVNVLHAHPSIAAVVQIEIPVVVGLVDGILRARCNRLAVCQTADKLCRHWREAVGVVAFVCRGEGVACTKVVLGV